MHGGKKDFIFIRTAVPQEKVQHGFLAEAVRFEETWGAFRRGWIHSSIRFTGKI